MIGLLVGTLAWGGEALPLRVIDEALGEPAVPADVRDAIEAAFEAEVRATWPDAVAAGDARESGPVSAKADPVVHVGLRLTRFEEDRFELGDKKTVEVLRATVAPFAVDLGSGEIVASTPYSLIVTGERLGTVTDSDVAELREALVEQGIPLAVARFAEGFAPDRLETTVLEQSRSQAVVARGRRAGSFTGERWRTASGEIVEVVAVGEGASFVVSPTGGPLPAAGSTLVRPGLARPLGETAPRVLVAAPPDVPSPGPEAESVTMWVEEALAQSGWVVVPRGTELFGAQLEASAKLDIAEESLINAQTPPDRVAVPRLWQLTTASTSDERGTARLQVTAGLQIDVFDLVTGLLVQSIPVGEARSQDTRVEVVQPFTDALRVSVVKDAAAGLADAPAARPSGPLPVATVDKVRGDGVAWLATEAPLPGGVIGEVQRAPTYVVPGGSELLVGPAERIGVARVLGLEGDTIAAAWIAPGSARKGDRFVPVGGRSGGPPVRIESPTVSGEGIPDGLVGAALAGLHQGEGLAAVASGDARQALDEVMVQIRRSGFAGDVEPRTVEPRHALTSSFRVSIDEATKGGARTVTILVAARAEVTRDGEPVLLKPPSADEAAPSYAMWTRQVLELPKPKKKRRALSVVDLEGEIHETVHRAAATLGTRVAVMLGD